MARLYYDQPKDYASKYTREPNQEFKNYLEKVASLIPGEVLAGYLFLIGAAGAIHNSTVQIICFGVAFVAGLIATPFYLNSVAKPDKPKRNHIIVSTFGFIVWAYCTSGSTLSQSVGISYDAGLASFILGLFSVISGKVPLNDTNKPLPPNTEGIENGIAANPKKITENPTT